MGMTPIGNNTYAARVLWAADARATYPLVALAAPGLTFAAWRRRVGAAAARWPRQALVGVYNAAGCAIAVLEWNGGGLSLMAGAPAMLFDSQTVYASAARALDGMMGSALDD